MRDYKTREEVDAIRNKAQQIIDEWGIQELQGKSGLYFIKIYGKIIYIGESQVNLAYRIARHKIHILDPNDEPEQKYILMRELYNKYKDFTSVSWYLFPACQCKQEEDRLLDEYKPLLNTTFPIYNDFNGKICAVGHYNVEKLPTLEEIEWYIQS